MRKYLVIVLLACLAPAILLAEDEPVQPPSILSIIPGQGSPGTTVVVSGAGFNTDSTIYLGIEEVPVKSAVANQLRFEIPHLAAGNYALYVRQRNGTASRAYSFAITPVKPVLVGLTPDAIPFCASGHDRQVTARGANFLENAKIVFDGAIIRGTRLSGEEMAFLVPQVPGGLHQVQVKNSEDALSAAVGLLINNRPEILSVSQGNDYVNYYELNIEGINFQQGSTLVVDGRKVQPLPSDNDRLVYISCSRLVYKRYPYDPSIKTFQLVIVNPGGEESGNFTVSAP